MDSAIQYTNVAIIFATLLGPVLAVQAQKWLERSRAIKDRREAIFRTLMATRATVLSPLHVEALNAIPVEFYGNSEKLKQINNAWRDYLDHCTNSAMTSEIWGVRRADLLINLLYLMGSYLGYGFSKSQLSNDIYHPRGHEELEDEQRIIRKGLAGLFKGEVSIPMSVTDFPIVTDEEAAAKQAALQQLVEEVLEGKRAINVDPHPKKPA